MNWEDVKVLADKIQKLKVHLDGVSSSYEAEERLLALFEYIIWTFYKYYDEEEELDTIIENVNHILHTDDKSYMYDDLRNKTDVEAESKKQNLWREFMQKVIMLAKQYNWWNI